MKELHSHVMTPFLLSQSRLTRSKGTPKLFLTMLIHAIPSNRLCLATAQMMLVYEGKIAKDIVRKQMAGH